MGKIIQNPDGSKTRVSSTGRKFTYKSGGKFQQGGTTEGKEENTQKPSVFDLFGTWNTIQTPEFKKEIKSLGRPPGSYPSLYIKDTRTTNPVTGEKINPNRDLKSADYPLDIIKTTIKGAKLVGVDPYLSLAVAMQENLKDPSGTEPYHLRFKPKSTWENYTDEVQVNSQKNPELFKQSLDFNSFLLEKMQEGKKRGYTDSAGQVQAYNGYGKLFSDTEKHYYGHENRKFYGVDVTKEPLDLSKNPAYGKTVMSLKHMLERNQDIKNLIGYKNAGRIKRSK